MLVLFVACSLAFTPGSAFPARQPLVLTDEQSEYRLGPAMNILEDPSGSLTIEQVSSPVYQAQFAPSRVEAPIFGYTDSAYWVRLRLDNQTSQNIAWPLEVDFANTQYVDLYIPREDGQGFDVRQTGALRPVSTRDMLYPRIVFNLTIPTRSQQTYYLRFKSGASMTLTLTLWTMDAFLTHMQRDLMWHWLFYGALLALLIYHLFLLYSLREASYLYFVILLASLGLTIFSYNGYLGVYIFQGLYTIQPIFFPLFFGVAFLSMVMVFDSFLQVKTWFPKLRWVDMGLVIGWCMLMLLVPFTSYRVIAALMQVWALVSLALLLVFGIMILARGFQPAFFFILGWLALVAGMFLLTMVRLGILTSTSFTENVYQFGMVGMAVCWAIALADRINLLKARTENANQQLRKSERRLSEILEGMPLGVVLYGDDQKPRYANRRTMELLSDPAQGNQPDVSAGRTLAQAIQYFSFQRAGSREDYPIKSFPVFTALQGIPASADDIEMDRGNTRIPLEMWASPVKDDTGKTESAVMVFQDISQRKQAEAELIEYRKHLEALVEKRAADVYEANRKLELRLDWMNTVNKFYQSITGEASLGPVYEELSGKILQLLGAGAVFIVRWEKEGDQPKVLYCSLQVDSPEDPKTVQLSFQNDSSLRRDIDQGKVVAWTPDKGVPLTASLAHCFNDHGIKLAYMAPIVIRQTVIGALGVGVTDSSRDFVLQQQDLVERMAFDVASLIQESLLYDQALVLATTEERNRLARDLHDSVTQSLFSATLLADVLPQIWKRDPNLGQQQLDKLKRLTHASLAEMRTLLLELRPSAVTKTPLGELLSQLAEAVSNRSGLDIQLFVEQVPILPEDVQMNFYRIAQEAFNNVVKHSQANQISLKLGILHLPADGPGSELHEVTMKIEDDGVGFLMEKRRSGQLGIGIIQERAAAIQARVSLQSQPGHGTKLTLIWCGEINSPVG